MKMFSIIVLIACSYVCNLNAVKEGAKPAGAVSPAEKCRKNGGTLGADRMCTIIKNGKVVDSYHAG